MKKAAVFAASAFYFFFFFFSPAFAQEKNALTLSLTPPIFQINIGRGEFWSGSLKVVNVNQYDLTLYAAVMNFKSEGEEGYAKFIPTPENASDDSAPTLARWIEISKEPIFVPREKSADIPFSLRIPPNAEPGGHYAAILVGTRPMEKNREGAMIRVSSLVSSLLFVRIGGEAREEGFIREFLTGRRFYQEPQATFNVRFENTGNVHLLPQGDITIYNMWGKEKGKIAVNQGTDFGNVLPQTVRKFVFEWKGEDNFWEMGGYKAVATFGFGKEIRQNTSRTAYFWVVPLKPVIGTLLSLTALVFLIVWSSRAYIRRLLKAAKRDLQFNGAGLEHEPPPFRLASFLNPASRLRDDSLTQSRYFEAPNLLENFFCAPAGGVSLQAVRGTDFVSSIFQNSPPVAYDRDETIVEEKIIERDALIDKEALNVAVLNGSRIPWAALKIVRFLEKKGFKIQKIGQAEISSRASTMIIYKDGKEREARYISQILSGEKRLEANQVEDIVIVVGWDLAGQERIE